MMATHDDPSEGSGRFRTSKGQGWIHPAGFLDVITIEEIKHKAASLEWAQKVVADIDTGVRPWLNHPLERLEALLPKSKMQVYWLMICPVCRERLPFDPFNDLDVTCQPCNKTFSLDQRSPATYSAYAGTLYEGWGCSYLMAVADRAEDMALLHALGADRSYAERSADILKMFAKHIRSLPIRERGTRRVIWTYDMEGDCKLVLSLSAAYEMLRNVAGLFSPEEHSQIQHGLFKHWADAVFRIEEDSSPNHNGMFNYLSAVAMVGCAIEDLDYVDWAFGRRAYSPEKRPNHRSMGWLTDHNYRPDGGFWGLCSAYHLYTLGPNCRTLVLGHRLSRQMPDLFPPEIYDDIDPQNPRSRALRRAIRWFIAQAFPDLTMAPFGDMGGRVSLATYALTAEIGYRYLGIEEVGAYRTLREGNRGIIGLVYGVDAILEKPAPYYSARLSSGYVALKRKTNGNCLYAGLNALQPGEGHQHADQLNLLTYSQNRMLTGEKRTRYEDTDQRIYSGASYSHNTVTVDETSQVHGNRLSTDRISRIDTFVDLPAAQVAEACGDKVYEHIRIYRRLLCQFDEYLLDIFRVEGGTVHDWFYHGVGEKPVLSIPMEDKIGFEPALYVMRGGSDYRTGAADGTFSATWRLPAEPESEVVDRRRDVFSRVTVAGVPKQIAFVLNTYPDPGAHSLMVRRVGSAVPFAVVHEAFFDAPVAITAKMLMGDAAVAVEIAHADGGRRLAIYESGSGPEGWQMKGRFGVIEMDARGRLCSLVLIQGTELRYNGLHLHTDKEVSLSVTCDEAGARLVSSPPLAYETLDGLSIYAIGQEVEVNIAVSSSMSPTGREIVQQHIKLPGQTAQGPVFVDIRWQST